MKIAKKKKGRKLMKENKGYQKIKLYFLFMDWKKWLHSNM